MRNSKTLSVKNLSSQHAPIHEPLKAYDGLNNLLNLAYRILSWKVHMSLIRSKLEPYLGFLHSVQWGTPSLVSDFQELYRYLVDDFVIDFCKSVKAKDFILKKEIYAGNKFGKRQYISETKNREFLDVSADTLRPK